MNSLPIQMSSTPTAAADAPQKNRQAADAPRTGNSFQNTLKEEIADRQQSSDDKVAAPDEAGITMATSQASAESGVDKKEKETTEPMLDNDPGAMAKLLLLASQFMQLGQQPEGTARLEAGQDLTAEDVSLTPAGIIDTVPGKTDIAAINLDAATPAVLLPAGEEAAKVLPQSQPGDAANAKNSKATQAKADDLGTTLNQANLTQTQAGTSTEKAVQIALAATETGVSGRHIADQSKEAQSQPESALAFSALHQAGIDKLEAKTAASADRITPQVGTPDWNQAIGQKVVWMATNEKMSASMSLNPPDLGPLKVVISVSDNMATASFVSAHPDVRQALETALPRLREMLGDAGIQLGQTHVGAGTSSDFGAQAEQQQAARHMAQSGTASHSSSLDTHVPVPSIRQGLVDTFA